MKKKTTENLNENDLNQYLNINPLHSQNFALTQTNKKKYLSPLTKVPTSLNYLPRRKINILTSDIPFNQMGKNSVNLKKLFGDCEVNKNNNNNNNERYNTANNDNNNENNFDFHFENNDNNFNERNNLLNKFSLINDKIYKLKNSNESLSNNNVSNLNMLNEYYEKIKKNFNDQIRVLLDNKNMSLINPINLINLIYDLDSILINYLNLLYTELKLQISKKVFISKKSYELEAKLQSFSNQLTTLTKSLNSSEISKKIHNQKKKENLLSNIKQSYIEKENTYKLKIFNLQKEIKDLMILLDLNKDYYNKFKESEKKVEEKKKENDLMKFNYSKEIHNKNIEFAIEKDKEEELNMKVNELEENIKEFKKEKEKNKKDFIEFNAKIKKLNMIINERGENIFMLNEEMENYYNEFVKEKINHGNTLLSLQNLETRFIKEKELRENIEKKCKEKEDKINELNEEIKKIEKKKSKNIKTKNEENNNLKNENNNNNNIENKNEENKENLNKNEEKKDEQK